MTESSVAPASRRPYDLPMEDRVARLEDDMQEVKSVLSRLEPMIVRIDATLTSTLPNLATKAELADLRSDLTRDISGSRTEITREMSDFRTEITREMSDFRTEITREMSDFRTEMTKELSDFRTGMTADFSNLRADVSRDISELRNENICLRAETTKEIATLRTEMIARFADVPTKTYLWGILGVLITAYGSGLAALAILK